MSSSPKITYRPEIDGLRTIAVMAVLLYHLHVDGFVTGGFLGVDVFFVISGYLITSLIHKEFRTTGRFSFTGFYNRRIRRLLPILLVITIVSTIAGSLLLLPTQYIDFAQSVWSSIFFYANFYWHHTLQQYGAESGLVKPFLHTWTLSVEEQFYLLYPIFLLAGLRYWAKRLMIVIAVIMIASLAYAEFANGVHFSSTFYLLHSRIWELLVGCAIAIKGWRHEHLTRAWWNLIPYIGLILIAISFLTFNVRYGHPGLLTAVPIVGTALLICFPIRSHIVTKLLSSKLFVTVGLLSYSLYLWHYPIYTFARIYDLRADRYDYAAWLIASFVLSYLSYHLIEQPMRSQRRLSNKTFYSIIIPTVLFVLTSTGYIINSDGFPERFSHLQAYFGSAVIDNKILRDKSYEIMNSKEYQVYVKENAENSDSHHILILGDSHGKDLLNALYQNKQKLSGYTLEYLYYKNLDDSEDILDHTALAHAALEHAEIVLLTYRYKSKMSMIDQLPQFIQRLQENGKEVVLIGSNMEFPEINGLQVFDHHAKSLAKKNEQFDIKELNKFFWENRDPTIYQINEKLRHIAESNRISYVDKTVIVCPGTFCIGCIPDGSKSYYDESHWTEAGAKYFGEQLTQDIYAEIRE